MHSPAFAITGGRRHEDYSAPQRESELVGAYSSEWIFEFLVLMVEGQNGEAFGRLIMVLPVLMVQAMPLERMKGKGIEKLEAQGLNQHWSQHRLGCLSWRALFLLTRHC
jgi:hypothetical protein